MGWQDRDYARAGGGPPRSWSAGGGGGRNGGSYVGTFGRSFAGRSVVFWLVVINVVVFLVDGLLGRFNRIALVDGAGRPVIPMRPLEWWGYFSSTMAFEHGQLWRLVTFQFLHADIGHILFNMLGLFFFGPVVERWLGSRRFLAFYLLCGTAGAATYLLMLLTPLVVGSPWVPLIGASAGVFGVLIGAAWVAPHILIFGLIPIRVAAWLMVLAALYTVLAMGHVPGANAGGEAAHIGGAVLGLLLIHNPSWLNFADLFSRHGLVAFRQRIGQRRQAALDAEIDRILAKIKEHGMHALTEREKRTLNDASKSKRRAG